MNNNVVHFADDDLPSIDELHKDLRILAGVVGVSKTMEVAEVFGGTIINLAGYAKLKRKLRDKRVRHEYDNGASVVNLSRKYKLSIRYVKTLLGTV